jgi:hypothetical protein
VEISKLFKVVVVVFFLLAPVGCFDKGPVPLSTDMTLNPALNAIPPVLPGFQGATGVATLDFSNAVVETEISGFPDPSQDQNFEVFAEMVDGTEVDLGPIAPSNGAATSSVPFKDDMTQIAQVLVVIEDATGARTTILQATLQPSNAP